MLPDADAGSVPGWEDASLQDTAWRFHGDGADADLSDDVRFRRNVARLIQRRVAQSEIAGDPSIFFLLPNGPVEQERLIQVPMLNNEVTAVEGHLWFVGPVAARGIGLAIDDWHDEDVFARAEQIGVGDVPAILYETRTEPREARFYPRGIAEADNYELLRLDSSDVSLVEILRVVDHMYERSLKTPTAQHPQLRLWKSATRFIPHDKAESRVGMCLREGLTGALPTCTIRMEQTQTSGRLDLEVEEPRSDQAFDFVRHAILELKILRSFWSSGSAVTDAEIAATVTDGVRQAASYGKERRSEATALCCFDMRKDVTGEACFQPVKRLAKRHGVTLRAWHLFNSTKAYRTATVR